MRNLFKHHSFFLIFSFASIFLLASIAVLPFQLYFTFFYIGLVIITLGLIILALYLHSFFENQLVYPIDEPVGLIVQGFYNYSRNPNYLAFLCLLTGNSLLTLNPITLIVPLIYFQFSNKWFIPSEERKLIRLFGMEYLDYKDNVRRWI